MKEVSGDLGSLQITLSDRGIRSTTRREEETLSREASAFLFGTAA